MFRPPHFFKSYNYHHKSQLPRIRRLESLFRSSIHPLTPANKLKSKQITQLTRAIKTTLRTALQHRGSTLRDYFDANGDPGGFKKLHAVYDRTGENCRKCKTPIKRIVLGGRSTHFCPHCQKR